MEKKKIIIKSLLSGIVSTVHTFLVGKEKLKLCGQPHAMAMRSPLMLSMLSTLVPESKETLLGDCVEIGESDACKRALRRVWLYLNGIHESIIPDHKQSFSLGYLIYQPFNEKEIAMMVEMWPWINYFGIDFEDPGVRRWLKTISQAPKPFTIRERESLVERYKSWFMRIGGDHLEGEAKNVLLSLCGKDFMKGLNSILIMTGHCPLSDYFSPFLTSERNLSVFEVLIDNYVTRSDWTGSEEKSINTWLEHKWLDGGKGRYLVSIENLKGYPYNYYNSSLEELEGIKYAIKSLPDHKVKIILEHKIEVEDVKKAVELFGTKDKADWDHYDHDMFTEIAKVVSIATVKALQHEQGTQDGPSYDD